MSNQNEAHGDEDWATPPDAGAIAECTKEIITNSDLLQPLLNDDFLAYDLAEITSVVDGAAYGNPQYMTALVRACVGLKKTLMSHACNDGEMRAANKNE